MGPVRDCWQEACAAALAESDPVRLVGRIGSTITALERRYSEWGMDPATPAELTSILNALSALQRLMNETVARYGEASHTDLGEISDAVCDKPRGPYLIGPLGW
jgi:hypothetical protein